MKDYERVEPSKDWRAVEATDGTERFEWSVDGMTAELYRPRNNRLAQWLLDCGDLGVIGVPLGLNIEVAKKDAMMFMRDRAEAFVAALNKGPTYD